MSVPAITEVIDANAKSYQLDRRRLIFRNEDISHRCYRAVLWNDGTVTAYCYVESDGQKVVDGSGVLTEVLHGPGFCVPLPDPISL